MRHALVIFATLAFTALPGFAQARKSAAPPDITGVYKSISSKTVLPGGLKNSGTLADLPLTPAASQQMKTVNLNEDPAKVCQPLGPFRMMARESTKIQILPVPGVVAILFENLSHGLIRTVYTERGHPAKQSPLWMGDSIGKWEGDTLVIDTNNFSDATWLNDAGAQHSNALHLMERVRPIMNGRYLEYKVTADDAKALTKPYTYIRYYEKLNSEIGEDICEEQE
ncbi:MAG: hypothetical protein ABL995_12555 [Bryobacteraceae bacterium]